MVEEIIGLKTRFPKSRVLVTSRIAGFDAHPFESAGFEIATLDDLSETQIKVFAETWFALAFPDGGDMAQTASEDLLQAVSSRPQLTVLAGNPMILTIMAIVARHKRLGSIASATLFTGTRGALLRLGLPPWPEAPA